MKFIVFLITILFCSAFILANEKELLRDSQREEKQQSNEDNLSEKKKIEEIANEALSKKDFQYKVEYGDFLHIIALRLYGDASMWSKIAKWNKIKPPYELNTGMVLILKKKPLLKNEDGTKLVVDFWKKYILKNEPPEIFNIQKKNIDYDLKQKLELLATKLKLALEENRFKDAYFIMLDITNLTKIEQKVIFYWSLLLQKNDLFYESADIYASIIENKPAKKYRQSELKHIYKSANKFFSFFKNDSIEYEKKYKAYKRAITLYEILIQRDYEAIKSRFNLSKLHSDTGHYFSAFDQLYQLQKNKEVLSSEELKKLTDFYLGLNKISSGSPSLALTNLQKIASNDEKDTLGFSSKKIIDSISKKRKSGHISLLRGIGSNVSAVPEELQGNHQPSSAGYTQLSGSFNLSGYEFKRIKISNRNFILYNRQDLTRYSNLTNAYLSSKVEFSKGSYYGILPKISLSHSRLILNQGEDGQRQLKDFSYTHKLGLSAQRSTKLGNLRLRIPLSINRERGNSENNSFTYALSLGLDLWPVNRYLSPSFNMEYSKENYKNNDLNSDESIVFFSFYNYLGLSKTSFTQGIEYERISSATFKENSLKFSLGNSTRLKFISRRLSLKSSISYEKADRPLDNRTVTKKNLELGLSYFF